jgi:hypothetical protein
MTKRISRKALALAAVGVLASPAFAQVANAQIITKTIAVTLKAVGPVPTGVTGASVTVTCKNTTNNPGETVSAFSLTPGQTANLNNFLLTTAAPGSSCKVKVVNAGSANTTLGATIVSIGGAASTATSGAYKAGSGGTVETDYVPVTDSTTVDITMSFPQITVKKVVVGDEATAGFAYPMSIACSNPISPIFVSPANGLEAGGAGSYVSIPVTNSTAAVPAQKAFLAKLATPAVWTYGWTTAGGVVYQNIRSITPPSYVSTGLVVPAALPIVGGTAAPYGDGVAYAPGAPNSSTTSTPNGYINGTGFISTPATGATPGSAIIPSANPLTYTYAAGDVVIPGSISNTVYNYIDILQYNAATPQVLTGTFRVVDAKYNAADLVAMQTAALTTAGVTIVSGKDSALQTQAAIAGFNVGSAFKQLVNAAPTIGYAPGCVASMPARDAIDFLLLTNPAFTAGVAATSTPGFVRVYDYRTDPSTIPAGNLLDNWANLGTGSPVSIYTQTVNAINSLSTAQPTPNVAGGFNGTFALKGGESKSFSFNEFPNLTTASKCEVWETNGGGATATGFSSTNGTAAPLGGVNNANGRWQSNLTAMNETITVTNSFYGDMIISKVVTGDPKTNIATYEISVACDKGGPKDTFLIKDRQSKVYSNIASGTNCLITETKSDGAVASYKDNSGDNTTDGRVTIKRRPVGGCGDVLGVTGAPTAATPGGPAPTTTFNECWASVIITNDYNPVAAPETTKAAAAAPATAAPATAAPAVAPAPAVAVDATPTFAG